MEKVKAKSLKAKGRVKFLSVKVKARAKMAM